MNLSKKQTVCIYLGHDSLDGIYSTIEEMAEALDKTTYIDANRLYIRAFNQRFYIDSVGYINERGDYYAIGTTNVWSIRDMNEIPSEKVKYVLEAGSLEFDLTKKEAVQFANMLNSCLKRQCAA